MDFLAKVTNTTREMFLDKVVDGVLEENPLFESLVKNSKSWSGEKVKSAIKVKKGKNSTAYGINDIIPLDSDPDTSRLHFSFDPKFRSKTVAIPLGRLLVNSTSNQEDKFLDLAAAELESSAQDLSDELGEILYGTGTGNDFAGLESIVDDGTNTLTYGGLTRSAYPTALTSTVVDAGGSLTLAAMRTTMNGAKRGTKKPTVGYCNEEVWGFYEALLQPQERIMKTTTEQRLSGNTGFDTLFYIGTPIISDEHATEETLYFLREKMISFHTVDMAANAEFSKLSPASKQIIDSNYEGMNTAVFYASDWELPSTTTGFVMQMGIGGEVITRAPRDHAKLVNITSV